MKRLYRFKLFILIVCTLCDFSSLAAQKREKFPDFEKSIKVLFQKADSLAEQIQEIAFSKADSGANASAHSWVEVGPQRWTSSNLRVAGVGLSKVSSNEALDTCNLKKRGCFRVVLSETKLDSTYLYNLYSVQQFTDWGPAELRLPTEEDLGLLNRYLATLPCNAEGKNSAGFLKDFMSWEKAKGSDMFKFGFKRWLPETGRNGFWIKPKDDFEKQAYPAESVLFFDQPEIQDLKVFKRTKEGFHFFIRCLVKQ